MRLPQFVLPDFLGPEERAQLIKDMSHDFTGQAILGFTVSVTGRRIGESALAFIVVLIIVTCAAIKHRRRLRRAKLKAQTGQDWITNKRIKF